MSFDDLPEHWDHLPLDDPALQADVVDLVVGHHDRVGGCLAFLLLDEGLRLTTPCVIGEVPGDGGPDDVAASLDEIVKVVAGGSGAILFARGRDGSVLLTDHDRRWHDGVLAACRRRGVRLVGAFLAVPAVVRPFPAALTAADADALAS